MRAHGYDLQNKQLNLKEGKLNASHNIPQTVFTLDCNKWDTEEKPRDMHNAYNKEFLFNMKYWKCFGNNTWYQAKPMKNKTMLEWDGRSR